MELLRLKRAFQQRFEALAAKVDHQRGARLQKLAVVILRAYTLKQREAKREE